ncbi:MAG: decaprenyl-phosphate phosphoribosyltransferase [Myxococcales bacterium]|nr:decaprenyl-phosphate phosphoribosyltransferase [Myxococcales bacterium]
MTTSALDTQAPILPIAMIRALRPRQWAKNAVLLVPLLFAKGVLEKGLVFHALAAVAAFSLLASGVYVVNDWVDREKDRLHPEKRKRPIAAGHLNGTLALLLLVLCWGGAAGIGWYVGQGFLGVMGGYLVLQVLYTGALKKLVILDVMAIALGFIVRVVAGAVAINVEVSNWLFLCTLLGAVFLGFAKRRAELSSLEDMATAHRSNLADYSLPMIDQMMSISAASAILGYGLYTVSRETVERVGSDRLKFTVPLVVYAVFRYLFLVHKRGAGGAPEKVVLGDVALLATIALYLAVAAWALYV